jgi:hypothetical protein
MEPKHVTVRQEELRWLADNRSFLEENHAGRWLALKGYKLIAIGDSLDEVMDAAEHQDVKDPIVTAVRRKEYQDGILIRNFT